MVPENEAAPVAEPECPGDLAGMTAGATPVLPPADTEFSDDVSHPRTADKGEEGDGDEYVEEEAGQGDFAEYDEDAPITYADFGLMTEDELAFAFDLTKNTMAKWRKNEDVDGQSGPAFVRIGKTVYYRCDDVDLWIEGNIEHPPAHAPRPLPAPVAVPVAEAA